jgi:DMSO/TMAO reductase YedYZ heme-binding membrane subunit
MRTTKPATTAGFVLFLVVIPQAMTSSNEAAKQASSTAQCA